MKIALLGDTHANGAHTYLMVEQAHADEADVIVQLGDFAYAGDHRWKFLNLLEGWLRRHNLRLYWIDGNHDDHESLELIETNDDGFKEVRERIFYIPRGHRWTWDGIDYMGVGGAYSIDKGWRLLHNAFWSPFETITYAQAMFAAREGNVDIMFTHDVPWGIKNPYGPQTGGGDKDMWPESAGNRRMLRGIVDAVEPDVLFHGHCHHYYQENLTLDSGHVVEVTGLARDTMAHSYLLFEATNVQAQLDGILKGTN
jgi:Icc-related predicted phosphoesterase